MQLYIGRENKNQLQIGGAADKLRNGLHKLTEARVQVEEMSVELEIKQDIVAKKQKECQELLVVIVEKRMAADEQQKQVEADQERIGKDAAETRLIAEDAERDLAKVRKTFSQYHLIQYYNSIFFASLYYSLLCCLALLSLALLFFSVAGSSGSGSF